MRIIMLYGLLLMMSAVSLGETNIGGVNYYSRSEVEALGVGIEGDTLVSQGKEIRLDGKNVSIGDYKVLFKEDVEITKGDTYYNAFLIEGLLNANKDQLNIERIVSLSPGITEKVFALGLGDALVGRTVFCKYPKEAQEVDEVGSMLKPTLEKIIVKNPDIILMETHYNEGFVGQLKKVGINYRLYRTPKNLEELYDDVLSLGEVLGVELRANILVASLKTTANKYKWLSKGQEEKPKVYYVVGTGRKEYTAGGDTFIGDLIEVSGGDNIAKDHSGWNISLEEIIVKNPEYIIGSKNDIAILKTEKKYSLLKAVKDGNLIEVDSDIYNLPGVRAVDEGIPLIYNSIH